MKLLGAVFDLDGVLVDTARYHYAAWRDLARHLDIPFTERDNERLKGVSRMASLEILLSLDTKNRSFSEGEKLRMAEEKNRRYVALVSRMRPEDILPGSRELLAWLRGAGVKTALGSASKNAPLILRATGLEPLLDAVVDGNSVARAKPAPDVFLEAARRLGLPPAQCAVFEDALAGIQAAKAAGCYGVGIGETGNLPGADRVYRDLAQVPAEELFSGGGRPV